MSRINVEEVKHAAAGRWVEILTNVAGVPAESLKGDSKEHPCPKCGGSTRFRLIDKDAGAVFCSHCFDKNNGDGIAAVQWALTVSFQEALRKIADYLGVKPEKSKTPDSSITWDKEWSSQMLQYYLQAKPGLKEEAFHLAGARMGNHRKHSVIAFPVIGSTLDLERPVNYVCVDATGGRLPTGTVKEPGEPVDKKVVGGKAEGIVGLHGMSRLLTPGLVEVVWKVEGLTDLLALQGMIPEEIRDRHVVVTSGFGCGEDPRWMAAILAKAGRVLIIGDQDEAGEAGARRWAKEVAQQKDEGATLVQLPYPMERKKGKDIRDFVLEGHNYDSLLDLADNGEVIKILRDAEGDQVANEQVDTHFERKICRDLQLEVIGEKDGKIHLYSMMHQKTEVITDVSKLTHEKLMQICGPPAKSKVKTGDVDRQADDVYKLSEVKQAIALVAGYRRIEEGIERGAGIWGGKSLDGEDTKTIVVVNSRDAARWNGDKVLRHIKSPRVDGLLLDLSSDRSWYDHDKLAATLKSAESEEFCEAALEECRELYSRWRWRNQETDPTLITGLVLASWVQTMWPLRPLIAIEGCTNSGKSLLFESLGGREGGGGGIFGNLAMMLAKPSEAGLRQAVGNTALILLIDEFERSKEREKALKTLRTSKDATQVAMGSASGKVSKFGLKHIVWIAAIEAGLVEQADKNRYIQFELLPAEKDKQNQLRIPTHAQLGSLGLRLAAIAMVHVHRAIEIYEEIRQSPINVDARILDLYSIPAAILASVGRLTTPQATNLLGQLLSGVDQEESRHGDSDDLLGDIFDAQVHVGPPRGNQTIAQLLETACNSHLATDGGIAAREHLEKSGLKVVIDDDGTRSFFLSPRTIQKSLLRFHEQWSSGNIKRLLERLPGAQGGRQRIGGRHVRGVLIPDSFLAMEDDVETAGPEF